MSHYRKFITNICATLLFIALISFSNSSFAADGEALFKANCANCHLPEGTGQGPADMRYTTAFAEMSVCGQEPQEGDLGVDDAVLIDPGSPETSLVSLRMHAHGYNAPMEDSNLDIRRDAVDPA